MTFQKPETLKETVQDIIALHKESRALPLMLVWSFVSILVLFPPSLVIALVIFFALFGAGANHIINANRKYSIIDRAEIIWSVLAC